MGDYDQGGDDMFYIVENLIEYLGSPEIEGLRSQGKGVVWIFSLKLQNS